MARPITASVLTEIDAAGNRYALLFLFDVKETALRFWTGFGDLIWNSDTYTGSGDVIKVGEIEEATDNRAVRVPVLISGIPAATRSKVFNHTWRNRDAKIWIAFFDTTPAIISNPIPLFFGRMDTLELLPEPDSTLIEIGLEGKFIKINRTKERRYTNEDQIDRFPGDIFFDGMAESVNRDLPWGKKSSPVTSTAGGIPGIQLPHADL